MRTYILLLLICIISNHSNAQYDILLNKSFAERVRLIDSIMNAAKLNYKSIRAAEKYASMAKYAKEKNDDGLLIYTRIEEYNNLAERYCIRGLNDTNYKNTASTYSDILEAAKKTSAYLYVRVLEVQAAHMDYIGNNNAAFELRLKAQDIYRDFTSAEYPFKLRDMHGLGGSYYKFKDYHAAIACFKTVVDSTIDKTPYLNSLNTYAMCYRNLRKLDSAEYYFDLLQKKAKKHNAIEWVLIAKLNLAHTAYKAKDIEKSHLYATDAYNFATKYNMAFGISEAASALALIAYDKKEYKKAKSIALKGVSVFEPGFKWYFMYKHESQDLFEVLARVYKHEGNYKMAYTYLDSLLMVVDSTSSNRMLNLSNAMQTKNQLLQSKYLQEKENVRIIAGKHKQTRNGIIVGLALLAIISILFINNQRIKRRQLETEKESAETKLNASKKQLTDYTKHLQEKNTLLEEFTKELERYKTATNIEAQNCTIQKLEQSTILTDEDWVKFKEMFDEVYSGYLYRLKEKLPNLTPGEIRFMALSKLKLTTKEMAGILGVGMSTVRKYRHQVRNKLALPDDFNIDDIADTI